MRGLAWVEAALWGQRGHLFPWAPVCVAAGIGAYFALRVEPGLTVYAGLAGLFLCLTGAALRWPGAFAPLATAAALAAFGFGLAGARAHWVAAPKLEFRYYGPIEGRVVALDRSASDAPRVTLDRVYLARTDPRRLPGRVRLSLHGEAAVEAHLIPGQRVMTTGHLSPPQGPAEPGGFDFRRHAWFQGLGAVGYTRVPVLVAAPPDGGLAVFALRIRASEALRARLPGDTGGFAAARDHGRPVRGQP